MSMSFRYSLIFVPVLFLLLSFTKSKFTIHLDVNASTPEIIYAVEKIKELQKSNEVAFSSNNSDLTIQTALDTINLVPEAYRIESKDKFVKVFGGDDVGLMYGLIEVKNQLKSGKRKIESKEESPNLMFRAIKFNLPWDSYRRSEALSLHYETCRDTNYWDSFLDMMVENRFNKLTLWNLHPFSYMVKTTKYPEACSVSEGSG